MKLVKESRDGFEIEAELVGKIGKKAFRQPFAIKVNSLDYDEIQPVIDYWRNHLKENDDPRKLVIKNIYRVERIF